MTNRICVAEVVAAHGIKGQVKVKCHLESPEHLADYTLMNEQGDNVEITLGSIKKNMVLATIAKATDRNMAETQIGLKLYIDRDALPKTEKDEYYPHELLGLAVKDQQGNTIGTISNVVNYGAGDIIELALENGKKELLPFNAVTIDAVDLKVGAITLNMPEIVIVNTE